MADHCSNIGVCVTQVHEDAFDTHQHLKQIKHGPDETFYRALEVIRNQYQLPEIKDEQAAAQMQRQAANKKISKCYALVICISRRPGLVQ